MLSRQPCSQFRDHCSECSLLEIDGLALANRLIVHVLILITSKALTFLLHSET